MVISIMQPYFFPYFGYFQLIASCDQFVVADDAQYIGGGWVNRNRILVEGAPSWITMPVAKADHRLPINARRYLLDDRRATKIRRRVVENYRGAPYFEDTMAVVDEALGCSDPNVSAFNVNALTCVARRLGIQTPLRLASALPPLTPLRGQALVIDRCTRFGATYYVNPIGGVTLYDPMPFEHAGVQLRFLAPDILVYPQFGGTPVPSLSIIDVLMFNDVDTIKQALRRGRLLEHPGGPTGHGADEGRPGNL